jgi:hypothetical protein
LVQRSDRFARDGIHFLLAKLPLYYNRSPHRDVIGVQTAPRHSNSSTSRYECEKRELPTLGQENEPWFKRGDCKVATFPFFIFCRMIVSICRRLHTASLE